MYKVLDLSNKNEWTEYFNKLPLEQQDIYYTPEYYSLYENYGDGKAKCFVFEKDGEIALYPFLINCINNLGYNLKDKYFDIQGAYGYNGVISSSNSPYVRQSFYEVFLQYCLKHNIVAEFTRFHPLIENQRFSENNLRIILDRKTVYVDLSQAEEEIFRSFQTSTRKQIKRTVNNHKIEVIQKRNDNYYLDTLFHIYNEAMERVNSINYLKFNKRYFYELLNNHNTIQFIAIYQNNPIAILTAIMGKEYMHGHLGGALTKYMNLSVYSLLYWEMIKKAKSLGKKYLNIGGGSTTDQNDNLFTYKRHFSNYIANFYIGKRIYNQEIYQEIMNQWSTKHPESYSINKNMLLGYREI